MRTALWTRPRWLPLATACAVAPVARQTAPVRALKVAHAVPPQINPKAASRYLKGSARPALQGSALKVSAHLALPVSGLKVTVLPAAQGWG